MATYAIGDLHGCYRTFRALLEKLEFDPAEDRLWLVGDLVNRGPDPVRLLRWVSTHEKSVRVVQGNHDLHLLAYVHGVRKAKAADRFEKLMNARDRNQLLDWLLHLPLIHSKPGRVLVHAGIPPAWTLDQAVEYAREAESALQKNPAKVLRPRGKDFNLSAPLPHDTCRVLTLLRSCYADGTPNLGFSGSLPELPDNCCPWYEFPKISETQTRFIFGHWANLGFYHQGHITCLDSGCVYGGTLTAVCLEDDSVTQIANCD
ncbi:MAG: symmetrical bis(5'-nucleosyl)-tetraphosphatase [Acidobacteriota bacterium]|nr:MAG: symmetrical bis(5'-nucleosyl)-tetraphosphatase [Acidobacteriota bacterium]